MQRCDLFEIWQISRSWSVQRDQMWIATKYVTLRNYSHWRVDIHGVTTKTDTRKFRLWFDKVSSLTVVIKCLLFFHNFNINQKSLVFLAAVLNIFRLVFTAFLIAMTFRVVWSSQWIAVCRFYRSHHRYDLIAFGCFAAANLATWRHQTIQWIISRFPCVCPGTTNIVRSCNGPSKTHSDTDYQSTADHTHSRSARFFPDVFSRTFCPTIALLNNWKLAKS